MFFNTQKIMTVATLIVAAMMLLSVALPVFAAPADDPFGVNVIGEQTGLGNKDLRTTIGSIIKVALSFLGVIAIVIVLIGGFKYMTAGGSDEKVGDAKKFIISGIIGIAIILMAYAVTQFVLSSLITATIEE